MSSAYQKPDTPYCKQLDNTVTLARRLSELQTALYKRYIHMRPPNTYSNTSQSSCHVTTDQTRPLEAATWQSPSLLEAIQRRYRLRCVTIEFQHITCSVQCLRTTPLNGYCLASHSLSSWPHHKLNNRDPLSSQLLNLRKISGPLVRLQHISRTTSVLHL
jgi:hypothetical protein